ncbi:DUF937 domain-containing protein [Mucilaginibacter sp.]
MFDQILEMVKDHIGGNPQVANAIPQGQHDDINQEIASHVNNGLQTQAAAQGGAGGLLSQLSGSLQSGNPVVNAIQGGLVATLGSKFGLPPAATGAIAAALPGLLQKFAHKANDPNDDSITPDSINSSFSGNSGGGIGDMLGGLFK